MKFKIKEKIQLGEMGLILGDLPHLLAGALTVDIYVCPKCKKLEFFDAGSFGEAEEELPQKTCPSCGVRHDFDFPKCPACGFDYYKR